MNKKTLAIILLLIMLVLAGCTQPTDPNLTNPTQFPGGWTPPVDANDFSSMPFDPNAVCPFACCKNEERYYEKSCTKGVCENRVCVEKEIPLPTPDTRIPLADNEVFPGVFIFILDSYETATPLNEYNGYPQYGPIGIYQLGPNEAGESFDYNAQEKLVVVELRVENRSLDAEYYRMEQNFEEALRFYLRDTRGVEIMEDLSPPQEYESLYEYYSEYPRANKGEQFYTYVAFRVPTNFVYTDMIMKQNQEDYLGNQTYISEHRSVTFPLGQTG